MVQQIDNERGTWSIQGNISDPIVPNTVLNC